MQIREKTELTTRDWVFSLFCCWSCLLSYRLTSPNRAQSYPLVVSSLSFYVTFRLPLTCDREIKHILPYISVASVFRNGVGLIILCSIPFEICPILLRMYMINVRLNHQPIFMMVVLLAPCSFRDMHPPALRYWTPTRSGMIPAW